MTYNADINFYSMKFYIKANIFDIIYYQIFVEAYWLIGKVEKYHTPICWTYNIIPVKIKGIIFKNSMLQIAFKAVKDIVGPDSLVPTLFVFSIYPRIINNSLPSTS